MTLAEAHEALRELLENNDGELELYTEYEKVTRFNVCFADHFREGSQCDLLDGKPFIYITTDH